LTVSADLNAVPRSIVSDPNNPTLNGFYDQVAWFTNKSGEIALSMEYAGGRSFDFFPHVYSETV